MFDLTLMHFPGAAPQHADAAIIVVAASAGLVYANRLHAWSQGLFLEALLVVAAYFGYFLVRGATEGSAATAIANAHDIADLERLLGLFHESALQGVIIDHQWLVNVANWVYIWGHWPVIAVVAIWLFVWHRRVYYTFRLAFLVSGGIGLLVFAIYPLAPPRLVEPDIIDTVTIHSNAYRVLQPPALVNQYAAMPSLHFGWNLLIGLALFLKARRPLARAAGLTLPPVMWLAVVVTGNHYIIDTLAGAALALFGLGVALMVTRGNWNTRGTGAHARPDGGRA